jgi:hypothetical protein
MAQRHLINLVIVVVVVLVLAIIVLGVVDQGL